MLLSLLYTTTSAELLPHMLYLDTLPQFLLRTMKHNNIPHSPTHTSSSVNIYLIYDLRICICVFSQQNIKYIFVWEIEKHTPSSV